MTGPGALAAEPQMPVADAGGRRPRTLFGHPPGLTVLFLTQSWAEFSYFGLQAMLVYYMTQQLGFDQATSSLIYGAYGGAAFFTPFLGGIVADRWLGRTRSVVLGGSLMMLGHFALASEGLLIPALAFVAIGNGLFLPPLAVQVGGLYAAGDPRRAQAFGAYYMGINLGGLLAPLVCGTLGEMFGWHWGFAAAGIGMAVGLAIYLSFRRLLPDDPRAAHPVSGAARKPMGVVERRNLRMLATIIAFVILFRIGYEQSGNVIALWVANHTDRGIDLAGGHATIPATWFQSLNPLLIIVLTPLLMLWSGRQGRDVGPPVLVVRMALGCMIAATSMLVMVAAAWTQTRSGAPVGVGWVTAYFVLLTIGELLVVPTGLALIGTLSPAQVAAMTMGAWYIAKFVGSLLAGIMGAWWGEIPATTFFGLGAGLSALAALCLFALAKTGAHRHSA